MPALAAALALWALGAAPMQAKAEDSAPFEPVPAAIARFAMGSVDNLLAAPHLWVSGGGLSANPALDDVAGIGNMTAPPWTTAGHRLVVTFNGKSAKPASHVWRPGEFERRAQLGSGVGVRTLLAPVVGERAILEWITLHNPTAARQTVQVGVTTRGQFGTVPVDRWGYSSVTATKGLPAIQIESPRSGWAQSSRKDGVFILTCDLPGLRFEAKAFSGEVVLEPGQSASFRIAIAVGQEKDAAPLMAKMQENPLAVLASGRQLWAGRIDALYEHAPRVRSSSRALVDFYDRSMLSMLMSRWDLPELAARPWMATSGIDGGALCCYLWDFAYISRIAPLISPESTREHILLFLKADLSKGYALQPFDGAISGVHYSYNSYAIIRLIHDYVMVTGDHRFLNERVGGKTVWELARQFALEGEDPGQPVGLVDYGDNRNLLELKKTEDYTGFVPSPNAERAWSWRAIDKMAPLAGVEPPGLGKRAAALEQLIHEKLWSPQERWFMSLDRAGRQTPGYSIQVFDLLRLDFLQPEARQGILGHLNEKEFLSLWGVHSYSKSAQGYDPTDVDWGGPGVYTGDAPQLVGDLLHAGCPAQADDVFSRILWWGNSLPYLPQAIRADLKDYRRDGRSNVIAGAAGAEMMIFDMLGLTISASGLLEINPHLASFADTLSFEGLVIRGQRADVLMTREGYQVRTQGRLSNLVRYGTPAPIPAGPAP